MNRRQRIALPSRLVVALVSSLLAFPVPFAPVYAQSSQQQGGQAQLTEAQLAALVAPIALYPDSLVSQVLMASTYPLEVAEAANWQKANANLKGNSLNQALQQQNWDASVKSLVSFPSVLQMMGSQLSWTQNLGNAVLAQQSDVMSAIQALRAKSKDTGALKSTPQQTVSGGGSQPIVIQPANPQVIYVPTYNPTVVYGAWPYPAYPPYTYYPPGYVAGAALLSFGVGMAVGAALWGGVHWGGGGWGGGGNSLTINNNNFNNFNRNTNSNWTGGNRSGTSNWNSDAARRNANLGGASNASRDAERNQLRQNLQHGGLETAAQNRGEGDRGANNRTPERSDSQRSGEQRSGEQRSPDRSSQGSFGRDSGDFGDARGARFDSGDHFGGGGRSVDGGGRTFGGGGGAHFGGFGRR